jgi:hypothetical protein
LKNRRSFRITSPKNPEKKKQSKLEEIRAKENAYEDDVKEENFCSNSFAMKKKEKRYKPKYPKT